MRTLLVLLLCATPLHAVVDGATRQRAEHLAREVAGVKQVKNPLTVKH